jgi:putative cardiolipin synthase
MTLLMTLLMTSIGAQANISDAINAFCSECAGKQSIQTATVILDKGETALLSRAWLAQNSVKSIDVQYFIWSADNVGVLAAEALLQAAMRGVKVRVIVDDFLINADDQTLAAFANHSNIEIKIYNPLHKVGTSAVGRLWNLASQFRNANQRMHDKLAIFDGEIAITGGRNMADEYFDFNREYSFRDRDVLVYGQSISQMQKSFNNFWNHELTVSLGDLVVDSDQQPSAEQQQKVYDDLIAYASDKSNFLPEVREAIKSLDHDFESVMANVHWSDARFIYDLPGKNDGSLGLKGAGQSTAEIVKILSQARNEVVIQSPYLVVPDEAMQLFKEMIDRGVNIKISTNSLASTDNLAAYSGFHKIRKDLLEIGVEVYEFKPHPENFKALYERYDDQRQNDDESVSPVFAIHAKSMTIDSSIAMIGTFNLDPRSIHLNTEVAMVIPDRVTASKLKDLIEEDMSSENSWKVTMESNPDGMVSFGKRVKLFFYKLLPIQSIL